MDIKSVLKDKFGFDNFRDGQEEVVERVLDGRSVAAIFPTGAGKSLCYQLPATQFKGLTLVVSPLISLMHDQLKFLQKNGIPSAVLDSTLTRDQYQETLNKAINNSIKVLMISVERFKNERFRNYLFRMDISLLVVDEAHCISEWGHNFRPEYLKLPKYVAEFNIPQVLLLTATATENVAIDMCKKLNIKKENLVRTGFYRSNLHLEVTPVDSDKKNELLLNRLAEENVPTIVYVTLQKSADSVASYLQERGVLALSYHAGLKSEERTQIQNDFMDGHVNCIVATIAFGMGIDKSDIRRVIHYDLPKSIENYSQEIGRAGRDGRDSVCEVFANRSGITVLENFIYGDTPGLDSIKQLLEDIQSSNDIWEVKILSLSNKVNIRALPLKTLIVYLEIRGIITSSYSYFSQYRFKTEKTSSEIFSNFDNNRQNYLKSLFSYSNKKRTWIDLRLEDFLIETNGDRSKAINALEYLDSKGFIQLESKQAVEVYKIIDNSYSVENLSLELFNLFKKKESSEILRVNKMIEFFESKTCLSSRLSSYFAEDRGVTKCGHCSVCCGRVAVMGKAESLETLTSDMVQKSSAEILSNIGDKGSSQIVANFLCGISMPLFTKIKARSMYGFSSLEKYPYKDVLGIITNK
ncbi:RecQ family ATP-dependent DNA helicase [Thiospirochaeta perfilievii]|uniref:ATP-dependent DNA helicase RecQ n=1 Tax=Thiospirochaeta perfilievii TaxID=252967 RepID=A0A5C1QDM3_9SPIO|nr:RecQ family ATP-dependent DNA helicase [Thiospirochaeta perfilievii]QEN05079.1 RecQ family ATP-dependent DNA helicase [Thiospirochaeta perfilievii]